MSSKLTKEQNDIVNTVMKKCGEHLYYLRSRWQDEKEYEDFNDYVSNMRKLFSEIDNVSFVKMTRAFKVHFMIKNCPIDFELKATSRKATISFHA